MRYDPKIAEMMHEAGIYVSPTLQAFGYPTALRLQKKRDDVGLTPTEERQLAAVEARLETHLDHFHRMLDTACASAW